MLQQMSSQCSRVGIRIRAAMISAVYNKAVRVEGIEAHVGDVIGLVSSDAYRLYEGCTYFHYLWSGPMEALAIIILLIVLTGVSALIGLGLLLLLVPFQFWLARLMTVYRRRGITATENRVGVMHEILLAIKMVKFYAWEESFATKVAQIRDEELGYMKKSACVKSVNLMTVFIIPPLMALSIFSIYVFFVSCAYLARCLVCACLIPVSFSYGYSSCFYRVYYALSVQYSSFPSRRSSTCCAHCC